MTLLADLQPGDVFRKPHGRQLFTVVTRESVLATENCRRPLSVNPAGQILVGSHHGIHLKSRRRRFGKLVYQMFAGDVCFVSQAGWLYNEEGGTVVVLLHKAAQATFWERLLAE